MPTSWHQINDFVKGWKLYRPGVKIVHQESKPQPGEFVIPFSVVSEHGAFHIYAGDAQRLLGVDIFKITDDATLLAIHDSLQLLLDCEHYERLAYFYEHPVKFVQFVLPKFRSEVKMPSFAEIFE